LTRQDGNAAPLRGEAAAAAHESPGLRAGASAAPAYELKFLVDEAAAEGIGARLRERLLPDSNGDPALGGAYRVTTLYLDTPRLDVLMRHGTAARSKLRLRRYGNETQVYLERKTKRGERVQKQRTRIEELDMALLGAAASGPVRPAHWFHERLLRRELRPTCEVAYERCAFVGGSASEPQRVTFDRRVKGRRASAFAFGEPLTGPSVLGDAVICELKFQGGLPLFFKELIREFHLDPTTVSKYRRAMEACGAVPIDPRRST
jgi:hypothetical protein